MIELETVQLQARSPKHETRNSKQLLMFKEGNPKHFDFLVRFDHFFHSLIRVCFEFPAFAWGRATSWRAIFGFRIFSSTSVPSAQPVAPPATPKRFAKAGSLGVGGSAVQFAIKKMRVLDFSSTRIRTNH
jgi:hypothetical protein